MNISQMKVQLILKGHNAQELSQNNRQEVKKSDTCGCFYCRKMFVPKEIKNWIIDDKGDTALCPYCQIDAVIGNASGFEINKKLLEELYNKYFTK